MSLKMNCQICDLLLRTYVFFYGLKGESYCCRTQKVPAISAITCPNILIHFEGPMSLFDSSQKDIVADSKQ